MPHPLTNFEIQKYYQSESRFNSVCSRDNLTEIKDGAYVINLDEYSNIGTHWVALYLNNNNVTYLNSFGVEHIPTDIKAFIDNKNIKTNIIRIQAYDSIMCGYFCIGYIDFVLPGKTLTELTNLFSPNVFKKNDNIILNYFKTNVQKWLSPILLIILFMKHQTCTQIWMQFHWVQIYQMINNLDKTKLMKLNIILLQRLEKENEWAKILASILLLLNILMNH